MVPVLHFVCTCLHRLIVRTRRTLFNDWREDYSSYLRSIISFPRIQSVIDVLHKDDHLVYFQERDGYVNVLNSYKLDQGVNSVLKELVTEVGDIILASGLL